MMLQTKKTSKTPYLSEKEFHGINFLHVNISSICRNFDDLQTLLTKIDVKFNVIGITETRSKKSSIRKTSIDLHGYSFEDTPTEANCGGALLYIDNSINYIVRDDLCIYRSKELESVFIEIIISKGKNTIVGYVYQHPCMNPIEFIDIYLSELLQNFLKEDKTIMLMGDSNSNLLKYGHNTDSASFLDSLYTNFLLPYISTPSHVIPHSGTLIDNIFSNSIEDGLISGNIISIILDHYAQFLLIKNMKIKQKETTEIYSHDLKNFNEAQFKTELCNINWKSVLKINRKDADFSFSKFFETFNTLLQNMLQ